MRPRASARLPKPPQSWLRSSGDGRCRRRAVLAALLSVGVGGSAIAATASGTLTVRVRVQPNCTVSSTTLDFGTYVSTQAAALNGAANIAYTNCPAGQLKFELDGGANGTVTARKMSNGASALLNYGLYRDTARTQNFAEGASAKLVTLTATGSGTVRLRCHSRRPGGRGRHLHRHGPDHADLLTHPPAPGPLEPGPPLLQERPPPLGEIGMAHGTIAQRPALFRSLPAPSRISRVRRLISRCELPDRVRSILT